MAGEIFLAIAGFMLLVAIILELIARDTIRFVTSCPQCDENTIYFAENAGGDPDLRGVWGRDRHRSGRLGAGDRSR